MKVSSFVMDELMNKVSEIASTLDSLTKRIDNIELESKKTKEETSSRNETEQQFVNSQ